MTISKLAIVAGLLTSIATVVKEVEARSFEAEQQGQEVWTGSFKRELALTLLEDLYNLSNPAVQFAVIRDTVTSAIATIVSVYNAIGVFRKSLKTAQAA